MKKKLSIITLILSILILAIGCSTQDKPEDTVSEYVEAMKEFDMEAMASKINPENRGELEDFTELDNEDQDSFEKYFLDYMKTNAKKITYKINESEVDGDKAVVNVDFKYVDGSPLFRATFGDFMAEMFALAFTDMEEEVTEEQYSQAFITSMEKHSELIEETFTEKTLDINCIKIDDQWYIDQPSDELIDVAMTNMLSISEELEDSFDFEEDEDFSMKEELINDDINLIEKTVGDQIELKTINFTLTDVEEKDKLTPEFGDEVTAKEGAKFVLIGMEIMNTTKTEFVFPDDFMLIDGQDREFRTYSDSIFALDDYLDQRDLPPSIKEKGHLLYEVPVDAKDYYILMGKADTEDVYKIILK